MIKNPSITRKQLSTLAVGFVPAAIGLATFLLISFIQTLYDLPAIFDIEPSSLYTGEQLFGVRLISILWPIFVLCYFLWLPSILAGLVLFVFQSYERKKHAKD